MTGVGVPAESVECGHSIGDDPAAAAYASGHVFADQKGQVDGTLLRSGVRWIKLRWMHRRDRMRMWREVQAAEMPECTRACWEGGQVWLDEVRCRVDAQRWQQRRKDTWFSAGLLLAESVRPGMRPLTEISHKAIAAAIGVDPCYVTRIIRWYREQGLLGKILGGTRFLPLPVPEDETTEEYAARLAQAEAARQARRERRRLALDQARAELAARSSGQPIPPTELRPWREFRAEQHDDHSRDSEDHLAALASVYELRLPIPPPPATPPGPDNVISLADKRDRRRPDVDDCPQCHPKQLTTALTCVDPEKFNPHALAKVIEVPPEQWRPVEKRRAPRGRDRASGSSPEVSSQRVTRRSIAQRTAQVLLEGPVDGWCEENVKLPSKLRGGVARSWLAGQIRPLTLAGWTPLEIAWHLITCGGRYALLPQDVPNPRAFIRTSLRRANPRIRPAVKWAADDAEREAHVHAARMAAAVTKAVATRGYGRQLERRACGGAKREAILQCDLCDEYGWLPVLDASVDAVRCSHDPATGGW
jgi:hypothetical protein